MTIILIEFIAFRDDFLTLYKLSYIWLGAYAVAIANAVGIVVSLVTG